MDIKENMLVKALEDQSYYILRLNKKENQAILYSATENNNQFILAKGLEYDSSTNKLTWLSGSYSNNLFQLISNDFLETSYFMKTVESNDYENYIKGILSVEESTRDEEILTSAYEQYMEDATPLLSEELTQFFYEHPERDFEWDLEE